MFKRSASGGLSASTLLFACAIPYSAFALHPGTYTIELEDRQGEVRSVATLTMHAADDDTFSYVLRWDDAQFDDHFLSMRPFNCLPHPDQLICHLPYPYENRRKLSNGDLTDLEYDLLFLHKTPNEYGINAWNGLYFDLSETAEGLVGELRETDLNVLQAPPEDGDLRPIDPNELYAPSDTHWPRRLLIRRTGDTAS